MYRRSFKLNIATSSSLKSFYYINMKYTIDRLFFTPPQFDLFLSYNHGDMQIGNTNFVKMLIMQQVNVKSMPQNTDILLWTGKWCTGHNHFTKKHSFKNK